MFKGQPKKPLFKVGDTVHATNPSVTVTTANQPAASPSSSSAAAPVTAQPLTSTPTPLLSNHGLHLPPSTLYKVTSIDESTSSAQPHTYTLQPLSLPTTTVTESQMILTSGFMPGDFVVKLLGTKELCRVVEVILSIKKGESGNTEIVEVLSIRREMGGKEEVESGKVRRASEEERRGWFPVD